MPEPNSTDSLIRRGLLGILVLSLVGTTIELFLIKHTDGFWEWLPIGLLGVGIAVVAWHVLGRSVASLRALQLVMGVCLLTGVLGILLHFRGNVQWELERTRSLSGFQLYRRAVRGATPSLAPGAMFQLGLVGLLYSFRHPILRAKRGDRMSSRGA